MMGEPGIGSHLRAWGAGAVDLLLPPRCAACARVVSANAALCTGCWLELDFVSQPFCGRCGLPFEVMPEDGMVCAACLRRPPPFARARAALHYNEAAARVILPFKHGDRTQHAPILARWMLSSARELVDEAAVIVPVPLHWRRLFKRRYNQSALIARTVGREAKVRVIGDLLVRRRATPSQGGLGPAARYRNVAGAFAVRGSYRETVRGLDILLVDDVMTTGATLAACARALQASGARRVDAAVVARVFQDDRG